MIEREQAAGVDVLEGDEEEPEIGRHRDVGREILATPIAEARPTAPVTVESEAPLSIVVDLMRSSRASAVAVVDGTQAGRLVGIFTDRDLVERALTAPRWASEAVSRYMTPAPETLRPEDSLAYAVNRMSVGGFRHVPLVDREGRPTGMVSAGDLLRFLVELCPEEMQNLPPEPELAVHPRAEGE